jgi:hypothetical protein
MNWNELYTHFAGVAGDNFIIEIGYFDGEGFILLAAKQFTSRHSDFIQDFRLDSSSWEVVKECPRYAEYMQMRERTLFMIDVVNEYLQTNNANHVLALVQDTYKYGEYSISEKDYLALEYIINNNKRPFEDPYAYGHIPHWSWFVEVEAESLSDPCHDSHVLPMCNMFGDELSPVHRHFIYGSRVEAYVEAILSLAEQF